jgi:hypothetical protein
LSSPSPNGSWRVILVGLCAEECVDKSTNIINVNRWRAQLHNMPIINKTFNVSAHTSKASMQQLLQQLERECVDIFSEKGLTTTNVQLIPRAYQELLTTIRTLPSSTSSIIHQKKVTQHWGSINLAQLQRGLTFLHEIGEIVVFPDGTICTQPEVISNIMAHFISPVQVRSELQQRVGGISGNVLARISDSLLTQTEIGVLLGVNHSAKTLRSYLIMMVNFGICYEFPALSTDHIYLFPSLGSPGKCTAPSSPPPTHFTSLL